METSNKTTRRQRGARVPYNVSLTPTTYNALRELADWRQVPMSTVVFEDTVEQLIQRDRNYGKVYFPNPFSMEMVTLKDGKTKFKLCGLRGPDLVLSEYYFSHLVDHLISCPEDFSMITSPFPDDRDKVRIKRRGNSVRLFAHDWVTGFTVPEAKVLAEAITDFMYEANKKLSTHH